MKSNDSAVLSSMEIDALGEILNISLGSSATSVSQLLGQPVSITTPQVSLVATKDFDIRLYEPAIGVDVHYTAGLSGSNILIMRQNDVKIIVGLLLQTDFSDKAFVLDEMNIGAICEVMNQMMGAAATALSQLLNRPINISPPTSFDIGNNEQFKEKYLQHDKNIIAVQFDLKIGDLVNSKFINVMRIDLAKELVDSFGVSDQTSEETKPQALASAHLQKKKESAMQKMTSSSAAKKKELVPKQSVPASSPKEKPAPAKQEPAPQKPAPAKQEPAPQKPAPEEQGPAPQKPAPEEQGPAPQKPAPAKQEPAPQKSAPEEQEPAPQKPAPAKQEPAPQKPAPEEQEPAPRAAAPIQAQCEPARPRQNHSVANAVYPRFDSRGNAGEGPKLTDDESKNLGLMMSVPLQVTVEIGRTTKKIKEILDFSSGTIVELNRQAGSQVDVFVNGKIIAKGNVVVVDDNYGVRITEVMDSDFIKRL